MNPTSENPLKVSENILPTNINHLKQRKFIIFGAVIIILLLFSTIFLLVSNQKEKSQSIRKEVGPTANDVVYPGALFADDQIIVKFRDEYTYDQLIRLKIKFDEIGVIQQEQVFDTKDSSLKNYYLLRLKKGSDIKLTLERIKNFYEIEQAGPNYIVKTFEVPNDPEYPSLWGMDKINMPQAWDIGHGSSSVKVAIVDSGIDYNHPDLAGRIINGTDFSRCSTVINHSRCDEKPRDNDSMDDMGHGTHVAGIIGAIGNNSLGVSGVNWDVRMVAVRTVGNNGEGIVTDVIDGFRYAVDSGAAIINASLGTPVPCGDRSVVGYQDVVNYAISKGVLIIAASGNDNTDAANDTPASCQGVLTVGATDTSDARSPFSNYGSKVDIAAPGNAILSTFKNGQYRALNGTSMAAPHVSGVAALLLSIVPNLSAQQLRDCILNNADPITTDKPIGGKRLNAYKAISVCSGITAKPTPTATPTQIPDISPTITGPVPTFPATTFAPIAQATKKPTPTPVKTYSCHEKKDGRAPSGSIQIGDLLCEPN